MYNSMINKDILNRGDTIKDHPIPETIKDLRIPSEVINNVFIHPLMTEQDIAQRILGAARKCGYSLKEGRFVIRLYACFGFQYSIIIENPDKTDDNILFVSTAHKGKIEDMKFFINEIGMRWGNYSFILCAISEFDLMDRISKAAGILEQETGSAFEYSHIPLYALWICKFIDIRDDSRKADPEFEYARLLKRRYAETFPDAERNIENLNGERYDAKYFQPYGDFSKMSRSIMRVFDDFADYKETLFADDPKEYEEAKDRIHEMIGFFYGLQERDMVLTRDIYAD